MAAMEDTERRHIESGMDVFDLDVRKLGTVVHLYEPAGAGPAAAGQGYIEVKTGFLGLGKHYFIPLSAVRDVTEGGVFLSQSRDAFQQQGWDKRPADLDAPAPVAPAAGGPAATRPAAEAAGSASSAATWEEALPHYRARWQQRYGEDTRWENYEPRYRFAWEMGRLPEFAGQPWAQVEPELRRRWEVLHPDTEWATAVETVRDAWAR